MGKVINFRREKSVKSDLHTRRCTTSTETYIILIISSKTVTFVELAFLFRGPGQEHIV